MGVQVAAMVGGGNIFRGRLADQWGIKRAEADNIGMMATVGGDVQGTEPMQLLNTPTPAVPSLPAASPELERQAHEASVAAPPRLVEPGQVRRDQTLGEGRLLLGGQALRDPHRRRRQLLAHGAEPQPGPVDGDDLLAGSAGPREQVEFVNVHGYPRACQSGCPR
jgi:hypothetical protein